MFLLLHSIEDNSGDECFIVLLTAFLNHVLFKFQS